MADTEKKPYGDVQYADPKNNKYPIDTEAHCRAAWSYINMPKNQKDYSPEELASIKTKIKAAAKRLGIDISEDNSEDDSKEDKRSQTVEVETRSASVDNVDFGQRIITVLAVPYEQPAQVVFRQEMWDEIFTRSAFNGIETRQRRIPAISALEVPDINHRGRIVGRVTEADPAHNDGLLAEVRISRTERGDETLELARDDALSTSAGFMVKDPYRDQVLDRRNKIRRVNRAFLDHLAFVGQPAYPGAKVLSVRSEADLPPVTTPRMDEYLDDPIFQWAADRLR